MERRLSCQAVQTQPAVGAVTVDEGVSLSTGAGLRLTTPAPYDDASNDQSCIGQGRWAGAMPQAAPRFHGGRLGAGSHAASRPNQSFQCGSNSGDRVGLDGCVQRERVVHSRA